jgi:hypothetical protein
MSNPISKPPIDPLFDTIGGGNPRHEVAGCPTGVTDAAREIAAQQGGGAPETATSNPSVPPAPGEGVTEEQVERSGLD